MLLHSMPVNETGFKENDNGDLVPSVGYEDEYGPDGKIKSRGRIDGLNGLTKFGSMTNSEGKPLSRFSDNWDIKDGKIKNQ